MRYSTKYQTEHQLFKTNDIMQYRRLTDDTSIIVRENGESYLWPSSMDNDRNILRVRKIILSLLWIQFVSSNNV
jgi:hypothetical protein